MDRPSTESGQETVTRAREAAEHRDWDEAYEAYTSADTESLLGPADLYEWATAAYLPEAVSTNDSVRSNRPYGGRTCFSTNAGIDTPPTSVPPSNGTA